VAADLADANKAAVLPDVAVKQWGFGRFCRETLGLEPATLLAALGVPLEPEDIVAADPAEVAEWAAARNERWRWRFETPRPP
jgi:hypothetical protein